MADHTYIEWTDATGNPITGCTVVSPGCTNCYAMKLAGTRLRHHPSRAGLTWESKAGPVWTGEVRLNEEWLTQPLRWKRPRRIFVCAHGDLFHDAVPHEWIDRVFAVMALAPQHTFQVLTKRSKRMREYLSRAGASPSLPGHDIMAAMDGLSRGKWPDLRWPLLNVWLGVSVEDQQHADKRVPDLLATPAAVRFLSCEPLLGPVDLEETWHGENALNSECWGDCAWCEKGYPALHNCQRGNGDWERGRSGLDWVIVGGESGPRPMHPDWVRSLRDQCAAAGVPFFFKQWGEWAPVDHTLIPTPRERQAWVRRDGRKVIRAKVEADLDVIDREERRAGRDLYSLLLNVGKKRAGRLLDGVEHNGMPEVRP